MTVTTTTNISASHEAAALLIFRTFTIKAFQKRAEVKQMSALL